MLGFERVLTLFQVFEPRGYMEILIRGLIENRVGVRYPKSEDYKEQTHKHPAMSWHELHG